MNTSSRFAFAVHVLALLALQEGEPLSSEMIAGSVNTNPALIRRLLTMLANAGLTTSQLGAGGGALLAREPRTITLLEIYHAVDDAQLFAMHREEPNPACMVGRHIQQSLRGVIDDAQRAMEASLAARTLTDVVEDMQRNERKLERTRAPKVPRRA
ncbi:MULTISPECIES: Rrf2 family transcriptional regulator [Paraburkholderia]|uniref:Rrf2 family transcriptional regulator n=1 Tax=Paraburkholderia TaxID=1822464 RepID=UPI000945BE54|nr:MULTISPECIES: Rrf2 family transcriptional regulator [Paraburkholderia]QNB11683.1 Rrf2 family transcriptional regulator [Paraburkholderia tropica]RQM49230.1 Rrf2 family transcriptional regulator [Paraburkholderia bannensis]RQN34612.1 Rrf2 family transcriptional regulator [Paraburkholderia tropica]